MNCIKKNIYKELNDLYNLFLSFGIYDDQISNNYLKLQIEFNDKSFKDYELKIHNFESLIRRKIIRNSIENIYKSPTNISKNECSIFEYERAMHPEKLETMYNINNVNKPEFTLIFRSCLSSIDALLKTFSTMYRNYNEISVQALIFYFETKSLIEKFYSNNNHYKFHFCKDFNSLYENISNNTYLLLILEFVDINFLSDKINIQYFVNSLNKNSNINSVIIIIDLTIGELEFDYNFIKENLKKNYIIFTVQSGLKLDQFGLELSNIGILNAYTNKNSIYINEIKDLLISARTLTGTSILNNEESMLLNKIFNNNNINLYKSNILINTKNLYRRIKLSPGSKIKKIFWIEKSPFIIIKLVDDLRKSYDDFISELTYFFKSNNTFIILGTSFGFRHMRIEVIDRNNDYVIRISPGCYRGFNYYMLVNYLSKI